MEYTIQRPTTVWIEVKVEADNLDEALDTADELFKEGDYQVLDQTYDVDYDSYWSLDEEGVVKNV